jgi:rare lipoprotein A
VDESHDRIGYFLLCDTLHAMKTATIAIVTSVLAFVLHGCAVVQERPKPLATGPAIANVIKPSVPKAEKPQNMEIGHASWYGPGFHGKKTASGAAFNQTEFTAAHRNLPLGSKVRVINLENEKSVEVEINDRGPFIAGRIIDLSRAAARALEMLEDGLTRVRIEVLSLPGEAKF